MNYKSRSIIH